MSENQHRQHVRGKYQLKCSYRFGMASTKEPITLDVFVPFCHMAATLSLLLVSEIVPHIFLCHYHKWCCLKLMRFRSLTVCYSQCEWHIFLSNSTNSQKRSCLTRFCVTVVQPNQFHPGKLHLERVQGFKLILSREAYTLCSANFLDSRAAVWSQLW